MKAEPQALRLYVEVTVTRPVCRDAMLAAQNHTKFSPVGFQRSSAIRTSLNFVKKYKCVIFGKLEFRVNHRNLFDYVFSGKSAFKNTLILRRGYEIYFDEIFIIFCKVFYGKSLSDLTRTFNDERQTVGGVFPFYEIIVNFSFKLQCHNVLLLIYHKIPVQN